MESLQVKLINRSNNPVPEYATVNSAGMDLRANLESSIVLGPLERVIVPTGLCIELPDGFEAQIRPRSGLAFKNGITVLNSPGTIDSDYRGEIKVILVNLSNEPFEIRHGERIAQMVLSHYQKFHWSEVNYINDTERGSGGFGHTGKH